MPLLDKVASLLHMPRSQWTAQHTLCWLGGCLCKSSPPVEVALEDQELPAASVRRSHDHPISGVFDPEDGDQHPMRRGR